MSATDRKTTDLRKAQDLASRSGGMLALDRLVGAELTCRIRIPTAKNQAFPRIAQQVSVVALELPARYPFEKPMVRFRTPIWNPNVYVGGRLCYGDWKVMEFLDLFLIRLIKVVALDPSIINTRSPANGAAAAWYRRMLRIHPGLFPTRSVDRLIRQEAQPRIEWRGIR